MLFDYLCGRRFPLQLGVVLVFWLTDVKLQGFLLILLSTSARQRSLFSANVFSLSRELLLRGVLMLWCSRVLKMSFVMRDKQVRGVFPQDAGAGTDNIEELFVLGYLGVVLKYARRDWVSFFWFFHSVEFLGWGCIVFHCFMGSFSHGHNRMGVASDHIQ